MSAKLDLSLGSAVQVGVRQWCQFMGVLRDGKKL